MSETSNIAKMAERLAADLFGEFLWQKSGPVDQNWKCVVETHKKSTHPSDVVFYYEEPYALVRTYITCDLKSYSAQSISTAAIYGAVRNLALSLECAEQSEEWRKLYIHDDVSASICALLFVYNHDGAYSRTFTELFKTIKFDDIRIPHGSKLIVLGPDDIEWLDNVHYEIIHLAGKGLIPTDKNLRTFFYPHLVQKKTVQQEAARAATLEMLTGPWIILVSEKPDSVQKEAVVFYRDRGSTTQEFLYLIDYLMHYQLIAPDIRVTIRSFRADTTASANFAKAVEEYVSEFGGAGAEAETRLKGIEFAQINHVHTSFSEVEIGMNRG